MPAFQPLRYMVDADLSVLGIEGQAIKIIDNVAPRSSPFYLILLGGWCNKPQMPPDDDPKISDPTYTVTLPDQSEVSGLTMIADIGEWLDNGFPE